jgi:hypothetical protein
VLVPETYNVLINPRHKDAVGIERLAVMPYPLDMIRGRDEAKILNQMGGSYENSLRIGFVGIDEFLASLRGAERI